MTYFVTPSRHSDINCVEFSRPKSFCFSEHWAWKNHLSTAVYAARRGRKCGVKTCRDRWKEGAVEMRNAEAGPRIRTAETHKLR